MHRAKEPPVLLMHIIEGADRGRRFELPAHEPQLIGRSTEALPISDATVSRRHAELTPDDGRWYIRDLDSANGTFVNGRPVLDSTEVAPGDRIRCGSLVAVLEKIDEPFRTASLSLLTDDDADVSIEATVDISSEQNLRQAPHPLDAALEHLRIVYRLIELAGPRLHRTELLDGIMDLVVEEFNPDRAVVLLGERPDASLEPAIVRTGGGRREAPDLGVSARILEQCMNPGVGVLGTVFIADARFAPAPAPGNMGSGSIRRRSILCVPIRTGERIFGAIHLESARPDRPFTEAQLQLLNVVGRHAGLALLNADLLSSKVRHERLATVGETVASLSHSIKNILQGLRGGADAVELALSRADLSLAREGWPILNRNLDRIFALTLNMLAFSKPQTLDIDPVNLNRVIEEACDLVRPQVQRKKAKLRLELADDLPPIPADANAIHQAMMNLLFNAAEAIPAKRGEIVVRTRYIPPGAREGDGLITEAGAGQIIVSDNGPGIDPALRKHIFEPFASTKGQRGTGLGLAVTRKIIDDHGGRIDLHTKLGEGTMFTITLPAQRDDSDADDTRQPTPLPGVEILEEL